MLYPDLSGKACIQKVLSDFKDYIVSNPPWMIAVRKISMWLLRMPGVHKWTQSEKSSLELEFSLPHYQEQLGNSSILALEYCIDFSGRQTDIIRQS